MLILHAFPHDWNKWLSVAVKFLRKFFVVSSTSWSEQRLDETKPTLREQFSIMMAGSLRVVGGFVYTRDAQEWVERNVRKGNEPSTGAPCLSIRQPMTLVVAVAAHCTSNVSQ